MSFNPVQGGRYGFEKITTSDQRQVLGAEMAFPDGRKFRYVANGGTAIGEGLVVASEAPAGNHDEDLVITTSPSVGDTTISITLGGTAAANDLYAEGYLDEYFRGFEASGGDSSNRYDGADSFEQYSAEPTAYSGSS